MHEQQTAFENIVGKGESARNERFLLFPQCFLLNQVIVFPFVNIFDIIHMYHVLVSLFAAKFGEPEIGMSGKGLTKPLKCSLIDHQILTLVHCLGIVYNIHVV